MTKVEILKRFEDACASHRMQFDQMNAQTIRLIRKRNYWRARAKRSEAKYLALHRQAFP